MTFEGINPTPNPKPNPDGSYTVVLTIVQWQVFQEKTPVPLMEIPPPKEPSDETISITQNPSALHINTCSWGTAWGEFIAFLGINLPVSTDFCQRI